MPPCWRRLWSFFEEGHSRGACGSSLGMFFGNSFTASNIHQKCCEDPACPPCFFRVFWGHPVVLP